MPYLNLAKIGVTCVVMFDRYGICERNKYSEQRLFKTKVYIKDEQKMMQLKLVSKKNLLLTFLSAMPSYA